MNSQSVNDEYVIQIEPVTIEVQTCQQSQNPTQSQHPTQSQPSTFSLIASGDCSSSKSPDARPEAIIKLDQVVKYLNSLANLTNEELEIFNVEIEDRINQNEALKSNLKSLFGVSFKFSGANRAVDKLVFSCFTKLFDFNFKTNWPALWLETIRGETLTFVKSMVSACLIEGSQDRIDHTVTRLSMLIYGSNKRNTKGISMFSLQLMRTVLEEILPQEGREIDETYFLELHQTQSFFSNLTSIINTWTVNREFPIEELKDVVRELKSIYDFIDSKYALVWEKAPLVQIEMTHLSHHLEILIEMIEKM